MPRRSSHDSQKWRLRTATGVSELRTFSVGALREVAEAEPNNDFAKPQPIPFGVDADWCQNVIAAGSCTLRWHDRDYMLGRPRILRANEALAWSRKRRPTTCRKR